MKKALTLITALLSFGVVPAFAENPHIGTWKLNQTKTKSDPAAVTNGTATYTEGSNGMIKLAVDGTDKDGKPMHWTWEGKFDGKQQKVTGSAMMDSVAYTKVDDHTNKIEGMKDGKVVMTGTIKVAADGKSREVTTTTTDASGKKETRTAYYDKQ